MFSYIKNKKKIDYINRLRIKRVLLNSTKEFKLIYKILPILLNYNDPFLPGFIDGNVPYGICSFIPDIQQINWLKKNKLEFYYNKIHYSKINNLPILGVYSMGSTSSIAQNNLSDLDLWVFYQTWVTYKKKKLLKKKCLLIEKWAIIFGIKVNIFLIPENYFKIHNKSNFKLKNKNTISVILLDEFYRTAVRMAGKRLLWMIMETDEKDKYEEFIYINNKKSSFKHKWLDLGYLKKITYKDCIYSILSCFYKNFKSPFKLVLKITLLEDYILNCSNKLLLSVEYKKRLHNREISFHGLDSYCLMLERITYYLKKNNDFKKLNLVRCFFYLKVSEKLSKKNSLKNNWKRFVLFKLVNSWGWDIKKIRMLDNKCYLNINNIKELYCEFIYNIFKNYI